VRGPGLVALAASIALARAAAIAQDGSRSEAAEWVANARAGRAVAGAAARLEVEIAARGGFHINDEYPLNFRPTPSEGATFPKRRFDRDDGLALEPCATGGRDACVARLPVPFTPKEPGPLSLSGTVHFSVCNPEKCLIQKVELAVPVEVLER